MRKMAMLEVKDLKVSYGAIQAVGSAAVRVSDGAAGLGVDDAVTLAAFGQNGHPHGGFGVAVYDRHLVPTRACHQILLAFGKKIHRRQKRKRNHQCCSDNLHIL